MKKNQKNSTGIMLVAVQTEKNQKQKRIETVSYTHLTLPTILRV